MLFTEKWQHFSTKQTQKIQYQVVFIQLCMISFLVNKKWVQHKKIKKINKTNLYSAFIGILNVKFFKTVDLPLLVFGNAQR